MLPEGEAEIRTALDAFVRLDRDTGLAGRGFRTLDFRVPKQMVVRTAGETDAALAALPGTEI